MRRRLSAARQALQRGECHALPTAAQHALRSAEGGAVYVEFAMVMLPLWLLFMVIVQSALLAAARLVVQHAATRAVRAAIVVLEDDPKYYGVERGALSGGANLQKPTAALLGMLGVTSQELELFSRQVALPQELRHLQGGPRMQAIRLAAYAPLAILAPNARRLASQAPDLSTALGGSGLTRILGGMLFYNRFAAAVSVRTAETENPAALTHVPPHARVTVRVSYLYSCQVPLARMLLCRSLPDILAFAPTSATARDLAAPPRVAAQELEFSEAPVLLDDYVFAGDRFSFFQAEATLPNQGVDYHVGIN